MTVTIKGVPFQVSGQCVIAWADMFLQARDLAVYGAKRDTGYILLGSCVDVLPSSLGLRRLTGSDAYLAYMASHK